MSIGIAVKAKLKPEMVEETKQFFIDNIADTRNFEGCEWVNMFLDEDDPTVMFIVESWQSKEHYEKYHHWRAENGSLDKIRSFLAGGVERTFGTIVA